MTLHIEEYFKHIYASLLSCLLAFIHFISTYLIDPMIHYYFFFKYLIIFKASSIFNFFFNFQNFSYRFDENVSLMQCLIYDQPVKSGMTLKFLLVLLSFGYISDMCERDVFKFSNIIVKLSIFLVIMSIFEIWF